MQWLLLAVISILAFPVGVGMMLHATYRGYKVNKQYRELERRRALAQNALKGIASGRVVPMPKKKVVYSVAEWQASDRTGVLQMSCCAWCGRHDHDGIHCPKVRRN